MKQDGLDTMALTLGMGLSHRVYDIDVEGVNPPKRIITREMVSVGTVLVKSTVKAPRIDSGRYSHISDSRGRY